MTPDLLFRLLSPARRVAVLRLRPTGGPALLLFLLLALCSTSTALASTATTTTLAITAGGSTASSVTPGTVVTLTATVTAGGAAISPGVVNFCDSAAAHCTDMHQLGTAQVTSAGTAVFRFKPAIGSHSYKAVLQPFTQASSGTAFAGSSSSAVSLMVTGLYPTTTMIAQSGSAGSYTLTGTVVASTGAPAAPTGAVSFTDASNANYAVASATLGASVAANTFVAPSSQAAGANTPRDSYSGDFNGDGITDLAITAQGTTIVVLLGNGDGTFTAASGSPITVGNTNVGMVAADLNNDGKLDIAVTGYNGSGVYVLLGNGDGTFQSPLFQALGNGPEATAVADLNNDGNLDLVVCQQSSNTVTVMLGNGTGAFPTTSTLNTGSQPYSVAIADLNNDGNMDLAVGNSNDNTASIFLGNGAGGFTAATGSPVTAGSQVRTLVVGDFNGDGKVDLVTADASDAYLNVLLGNGDGTFGTPSLVTAANGFEPIATGDFNGDGKLDLATGEYNQATISVYLGNGNGTFQTRTAYGSSSGGEASLVAADFDGDGIPDLASPLQGNNVSFVLLSRNTQTASAASSGVSVPGSGTHNVAAAYAGSSTDAASTSSTTALTASPIATSITLAAAPSSSQYGQQVVLSGTVTPYTVGSLTTGGDTVTFKNAGASLGTGTLSSGVATLVTTSLPVGTDSLTAVFAGDPNFTTSTSAPLSYTVGQGAPAITFSVPSHNTADAPFTVAATSNSAGSFTYNVVSGPATISGSTVTLTGVAGTVVLGASEAANGNYAAGTANATFTVTSGSVWVGNTNASLSAFTLTGTALSPASGFTGGGLGNDPKVPGIAFDASGNLWMSGSSGISKFSLSGNPVAATAYTGGGVNNPLALAVDGLGQVWIANGNSTVSVLSNNGAAITPSTGYTGAGLSTTPGGISIDLSGNVWVTNTSDNSVTEIVGVAAPAAPLATALANGTTGTRP